VSLVCVCDKRVFVSNDIWRKFYGVYPKIAKALEPRTSTTFSPDHVIPSHFVYLLFIMRFVQLHFIANTLAQTHPHPHRYKRRQTDTDVYWYWCI